MFLKSIKLLNVRCFKHLELDFTKDDGSIRKWTILLGANGTGKSTILRALGLITAGSDSLAEVIGDPAYWIRNGSNSCQIEAMLQTREGEEHQLILKIPRNDSLTDILSRTKSSLQPLNDALSRSNSNYFVAGYGASRRLASDRTLRRKSSSYRYRRAQSVATLFDNDALLDSLEAWAMDLDYLKNDRGIKTVRSVLSSFLPGLKFENIDKERGSLLFKTPDGIVPLQYLSDGYQNVAAWIGDLLHRITDVFDEYSSPLKVRGVLMIDEVDLHLHPEWQRSLYSFLQKKLPNLQLIVTTHSAVTAQQAEGQEVHYLTRRGKTISIDRFASDPSSLLVSQFLMTDAFGLETDESLAVEKKKERYRKRRDKKDRSEKDEREFQSLKGKLRLVSHGGRTNLKLHAEQVELLKKIQAELQGK